MTEKKCVRRFLEMRLFDKRCPVSEKEILQRFKKRLSKKEVKDSLSSILREDEFERIVINNKIFYKLK